MATLAAALAPYLMARQRGRGHVAESAPRAVGSRAQVMHGTAHRTSGGLTKAHLTYNKQGRIVSKRASAAAKKANRLAPFESKTFKKGQKGGGWASGVAGGLAAAGGLTAATGVGAAATPFLEAGAGLFELGDAIFG